MIAYDPVGDKCVSHQAGTDALMQVLCRDYKVTNLGTFNCRTVRGSTNLSLHAEGRAGDNGGKSSAMREVADMLVANWARLGIQEVIFEGRIWRSHYAPLAWREYTGSDPHRSHVHWALTWAGAKNLTATKIRMIIGDQTMPLNEEDLEKIASVVDAAIVRRLGDVGERSEGVPRSKTFVAAVKSGVEQILAPDYLK